MKTAGALVGIVIIVGASACGVGPGEDGGPGTGEEVLRIDGESHEVQDLVTASSIGNARDSYRISVTFGDTGSLTLDFAAPNWPTAPVFPPEVEAVVLPGEPDAGVPITEVYGEVLFPGSDPFDVVHLLSTGSGTFGVSGTMTSVQFEQLVLTFPAAEVSTAAYTDSSPEVHVELPAVTFPLPAN